MWRGAEDGARCCSPDRGDPGLTQLLRAAGDDVRKCGYLRKQKHGHKRYFVLRAAGRLAPARLEYYESEKKFRSSLRAAAAAAARSSAGAAASAPPAVQPKRVIPLYQCFTVSRRADAKHRHLIALYTKDDYFAMVAESEQEQESWYQALSLLMGQSKTRSSGTGTGDGEDGTTGARARAAVGEEEEDDGTFKEVWQVQVKPKGLGQTKNLSGIYRLCLSSKEVHLVRLNAEVPSVQLQLLSIRRCGHSEHFFFLEVGRSSSIGPGEIWMQVDDSVVAQHMHETFLETMKALKAFADFRPRSKSQSSCTNPISFLSTRRHLGYLQPCLGMSRRSRTDSMASTPPSCKGNTYRFRTSSEGEGTMDRPFRTVTGSLMQLNPGRMNIPRPEGGRYVRAAFNACCHARSASLPVSPFPSGTSPAPDAVARPSSSMCGSPGDGSFVSDEYGASPGDVRYFRVRSNTPDPLGNTPPIREEHCFNEYMSMNKQRGKESAGGNHPEAEKFFKKRTFSLPKPAVVTMQQKTTQTTPFDEEAAANPRLLFASESPRSRETPKLEYGENGANRNPNRKRAEDEGYMPMMPGVAASLKSNSDYLPMAPKSASASKASSSWSSSQKDSRGYMMMFPRAGPSSGRNSRGAFASKGASNKDDDNEYMDMSPGNPVPPKQSHEGNSLHPPSFSKSLSSLFSLPKSFRTITEQSDDSDYVPMASPGRLLSTVSENVPRANQDALPPRDIGKASAFKAPDRGFPQRKAARPTKLPLGTRGSSVPRIYERAIEGDSPGEYINIDFSRKPNPPYSLSAECSPASFGSSGDRTQSPYSDYMSFALDVNSPKTAKELANSLAMSGSNLPRNQLTVDCARRPLGAAARISSPTNGDDDYTEMSFNPAATTTVPFAAQSNEPVKIDSPSSAVNRLRIADTSPEGSTFSLPDFSPDPPVVPQVGSRADPQGRRRHSSETFSPAGAAAAPSSLFSDSRRQSSASFDNIWFKSGEGAADSEGVRMSRVTSAGFQNGLNYIAVNLRDAAAKGEASSAAPNAQQGNRASALDSGTYVSIDFSKDDIFKCTSAKKD
ncbi:insulin receptor substrate 2-B-like [Dromiciops gliroides]|uniref:insulin receptor substrate 2-B-like n=1 Tax=Dromiciops gliroides TaxID=33562 RepID=UPI001CC6AE89|nr:insulin receptor substrate 2-B-like [Dromiciops gliroides]